MALAAGALVFLWAGHGWQGALVRPGEKKACAQSSQGASGAGRPRPVLHWQSIGAAEPGSETSSGAHGCGTTEPSGQKESAGQRMHAVGAPSSKLAARAGRYLPAAQSGQEAVPSSATRSGSRPGPQTQRWRAGAPEALRVLECGGHARHASAACAGW